ncbi:hypothetical protein O4H49_17040 [Kiloniella laminariae]|uniref:HTH araC/xylS-type domain-containing protein n=1 Tax=Kiloniella laminariae TaxID=454162 RepID=A0ABT4LQ97_9PROT|nr:hypothetical protein [Kiloniella laminariae]MCZ4282496.1 hypothetical protein [Kiloniella laminariae]
MADIIKDLKHKARFLHRNILTGKQASLDFIQKHPDLKSHSIEALLTEVKRKHCLSQIANALGFSSWYSLVKILQLQTFPSPPTGRSNLDYGKILSPSRCRVYTNVWSVNYEEAKDVRAKNNGFLLTYGTQYLVTEEDYITTLGLDPRDENWNRIGRDWANPKDINARSALYQALINYTLEGQDWLS